MSKLKLNYHDQLNSVQFIMKMRQATDMTDCTIMLYSKKNKLNCCGWSDSVWFKMKTTQDNDVTDHTSAIYAKIKTEFSWSIE